MSVLALAALSARVLAEAAAREGHAAWALDLFGDTDTRVAARQWRAIGEAEALAIQPERLLAALHEFARTGSVRGLIVGSGFDGDAGLLGAAARAIRLLGTRPDDVQRLRDPAEFFSFLDRGGFPHPEVDLRAVPPGWLVKRAHGCGGWHIRRAGAAEALPPGCYAQRERAGLSMSASFVAASGRARIVGINRQRIGAAPGMPFVYEGIVGPVAIARREFLLLEAALDALAREYALAGLGSLDFLLDGEELLLLEVNARVPASVELLSRRGLNPVAAHLAACEDGILPPPPPPEAQVLGNAIVYASRALEVDAVLAAALARAGASDRPNPGSRVAAGQPLCSVTAEAGGSVEVEFRLDERRDAIAALTEETT